MKSNRLHASWQMGGGGDLIILDTESNQMYFLLSNSNENKFDTSAKATSQCKHK